MTAHTPDGPVFVNGSPWSEQGRCLEPAEQDDTVDSVLVAAPATIAGTVTSQSGSSVAGVSVDLFTTTSAGARSGYLRSTATGAGGGYGFETGAGCYVAVLIAPEGRSFTDGSAWAERFACVEAGETASVLNATLD